MSRIADWKIKRDRSEDGNQLRSSVQAWAQDAITGEPVYIMELDEKRRGSKCGCECQSCKLPLIAVNAGKDRYIKRPHFRHPNGAEKSECLFLAARLAALQLLRERGVIELPARRVSGDFTGLSGKIHTVWIQRRAETVKIRSFDFQDRTAAVLTLDDGRQLRVLLHGTARVSDTGEIHAEIYLDLKDPAFAAMSPEQVRSRTTLLPDALCWHTHWRDVELQNEANSAARSVAFDLLDTDDGIDAELQNADPKFRRETVLHLEVKRILAEAKQLCIPSARCYVCLVADDGFEIEKAFDVPEEVIELFDVVLESRVGNSIPDVKATSLQIHGGVLLVEVTVTNTMKQQRLDQIKQRNMPTLEIDLSRTGGLISRSDLRKLVIDGVECKRWLCHPDAELQQRRLESEAAAEILLRNEAFTAAQERAQQTLQASVEEVATEYLNSIASYHTSTLEPKGDRMQAVQFSGEKLADKGFPEASDSELYNVRSGIVSRILAIKGGGGVGYSLNSPMSVMNAIKQSNPRSRKFHTIFLIAYEVYQGKSSVRVPNWYSQWVAEIKTSIHAGEDMYVRPRKYDRLLVLLFPEMSVRLQKPFGTEEFVKRRSGSYRVPLEEAGSLPKVDEVASFDALWLRGQKLEDWLRDNPESARWFFGKGISSEPPKGHR